MLSELRQIIVKVPWEAVLSRRILCTATPVSQLSIRCNQTYRNRYNHFESGYQRRFSKGYYILGFIVAGGFLFDQFYG